MSGSPASSTGTGAITTSSEPKARGGRGKALRIAVIAALATALVVALLLLGMVSAKLERPPYTWMRDAWLATAPRLGLELGDISPDLPRIEEKAIRVDSPGNVRRIRSDLTRFLWGADELPAGLPDRIERDIRDPAFMLPAVERIDRLTVEMEFGIDSKIYHFIPRRPNGKLVLLHKGHEDGGHLAFAVDVIGRLTEEGYAVAGFAMPLLGGNSRPTIVHPRLGTYRIAAHDAMRMLRPTAGSPVKFFLEPVIAALNYFEANYDYSAVAMTGLSGGGWTTVMAAALDERIGQSFPVAGSMPLSLRTPGAPSDYEQHTSDLYWTATYPELYVLGTSGNRTQVQILNAYDSCCFPAKKADLYRDAVRAVSRRAGGGCFDVLADETHRGHILSPWALGRILKAMEEGAQSVARCQGP